MPWVKLDDGFVEHEKILQLTHQAFRLHVTALCSCSRNLTDGYISEQRLALLCASSRTARKHAVELQSAGLWHRRSDGWQINDYLDYNPSAEKVREERRATAERQAKWRARKNGSAIDDHVNYDAILERDGMNCHICGNPIKNIQDVEFDHVLPITQGGAHSEDNIRVAHRSCNRSKNNRITPSVTRDTTRDTTRLSRVAPNGAHNAAPTRPDPSPVVKNNLQSFKEQLQTRAQEHPTGTVDKLLAKLTDRDTGTERVLRSILTEHHLAEADLIAALEAATGPGVRSPTRVCISELQKRAQAKTRPSTPEPELDDLPDPVCARPDSQRLLSEGAS